MSVDPTQKTYLDNVKKQFETSAKGAKLVKGNVFGRVWVQILHFLGVETANEKAAAKMAEFLLDEINYESNDKAKTANNLEYLINTINPADKEELLAKLKPAFDRAHKREPS